MIKNYYDRKDHGEKELWYKTYFETDIAKTSTTKNVNSSKNNFFKCKNDKYESIIKLFFKNDIFCQCVVDLND